MGLFWSRVNSVLKKESMITLSILAGPDSSQRQSILFSWITVICKWIVHSDKQWKFVMLTDRWSVFLHWKTLCESVCLFLTYQKYPLCQATTCTPIMHKNALSEFVNSLPCTCYRLDYIPLKLVAKTTASHPGWMQKAKWTPLWSRMLK